MSKLRTYKVGDEPVPGYRLIAFLGSGGFGNVWRASAPGGTEVALKIVNLGMQGALKEFRSMRLVKKVRYPNLTPILAIWLKDVRGEILGETAFEEMSEPTQAVAGTLSAEQFERLHRAEPGELLIAMGLGQMNLTNRLDQCKKQGLGGIPVHELLNYMRDAARAIDYLNSPHDDLGTPSGSIQHCDIKPSNILIVGDAAQVCDFSLVREVNDLRKTSLTLSPLYAAPEIIESNTPSPSTDQYSLALSYVELRTGELPFPPNASAHKVIAAHLDGKLDFGKLRAPERAVIRRASARKPTDRFATASEFVAALREAAIPEAKRARRKRLAWLGVMLLLVLIAAAIAMIPKRHSTAAARELELPAGFVAAPNARGVLVHDVACPDRILCTVHGLSLPLRLIHSRHTRPFYLMENKVTNDDYARFASENPRAVIESQWQQGPCGNQAAPAGNLPVMRVTCVEAELFARWVGGHLPTVDQWDTAAGRYDLTADEMAVGRGPFRPLDDATPTHLQLAVNRGARGPLPVGTATHDISTPFGCRDMGGNGTEWTCSPRDATEQFSPDAPDALLSMILRGHSYLHPEPLSFADLSDPTMGEDRRATESDCTIGFRVMFTFDGLQ